MKYLRKKDGFSLIELLIVVAILGVLAAIAIPGLLASKRTANEGSAISSVRTLFGAQMTYSTTLGAGEFAGDIGGGTTTGLAQLQSNQLIDPTLGSGEKSGYRVVGGREAGTSTSNPQFFFSAIPASADPLTGTGNRRIGIATDGVLRADTTLTVHYADTAAAGAAPPINN